MGLSIYVLKLSENKWYIGKTLRNVDERFKEHIEGKGSSWTTKYKPIKIEKIYKDCDYQVENHITHEYMEEYGIENVRGGSYTNVELYPEQINYLELITNPEHWFEGELHCYYSDEIKKLYNDYREMEKDEKNNLCYKCFSKNHFAKDCKLGKN